ncbi:hypothetical protein DFP73DRAFT_602053 [Morchella snyderi]|nr:hypothetical protein DFP73DRAFT_602053 [Morchella snyderi]
MASSSTPALPAPPSRLLLEWKNRDAPISQDLIIHNPGQVVKALVPDVGNFMTDLDSSILEAEEAPMGRLFEFIQNILREQGQAHLSHLEHLMGYFQEREEATRFALGLAHDDMDRRVRLLEDTLTRQMAEGSIGTEDGPQAMDFEYTKLTILPPPAQLSIPIMTAVSERRFTGRKVPTDLMWSLDKVRKIQGILRPPKLQETHSVQLRSQT